jgi:cation transporter-like permease
MSAQDPQQPDHERVERFKQEINDMGLRDPATSRDRTLLRLGAAGLILGPAIAIAGYFMSHATSKVLEQGDATIVSIIGLTLTVAACALFVRYSMAMFLRFWLARLSFEQQAQTDRVVAALGGTVNAVGTPAPAHAETT